MRSNKETPLVSVIVPAYNAEGCLERCVASVLGQSLGDLEIIIVDDGSVDGTGALADRLAVNESRVRAVHRLNGGLSAARNTGIENAHGEMFYFLDSDDYIAPDVLEGLHARMTETGAPMVVGGLVKVDEDGGFINRVVVPPAVVDERGYWDGYGPASQAGGHSEYVVSWGKLFKRSLFETERFDEGKIHEDEFIIHRLVASAGKVAFADTDGYSYVQTAGSIMHTPKPSAFLDTVEALLARAAYFAARGWYDLAFTSLCEARGSLSCAAEVEREVLKGSRFRELRARWWSALRGVARNVPGDVGRKATCLLFAASPTLYMTVKKTR